MPNLHPGKDDKDVVETPEAPTKVIPSAETTGRVVAPATFPPSSTER